MPGNVAGGKQSAEVPAHPAGSPGGGPGISVEDSTKPLWEEDQGALKSAAMER